MTLAAGATIDSELLPRKSLTDISALGIQASGVYRLAVFIESGDQRHDEAEIKLQVVAPPPADAGSSGKPNTCSVGRLCNYCEGPSTGSAWLAQLLLTWASESS